jgi:hypothetical protein
MHAKNSFSKIMPVLYTVLLFFVLAAPQCQRGQCISNDNCLFNTYCTKAVDDCEGLGTCTERPEVCPQIYQPVCGCDGNTYSSECEAAGAGVNVIADQPCEEFLCKTSDCGPQLGMPNYKCPDGTIAGPTGRCLRHGDGSCGWEIRQCPEK